MPFGCYATLRSLSHFLQLIRYSSRQLLCPSCHFIHFVLRSATLHHVRSLTICCKAWHTIRSTKQAQVMHIPFRKPTLQYSLGSISLHYVLHSFQSHSVHPLPIILRALRACRSCGFVMVFVLPHNVFMKTKTHAKPLHS
jgi:hypothetical protein